MLTIGLNLRMSEIHAALLLAQFQRIPRILSQLKEVYRVALQALDSFCEQFS